MSPVAAPSDRRFRRVHVKPGRQGPDWRALGRWTLRYGLAGALLVYGAHRALTAITHAGLLRVDRIVVRGHARLSSGEVIALLDGLRGESLIGTDLNGWRRQLTASAWVKDAALHRRLPSTVEVTIVEREPIGIGRVRGESYLVDESGVLIDEYGPRYADLDLPAIDGLGTAAPDEPAADEHRGALAARLLRALRANPDLAGRLSQIDVSDPQDAVVLLTGDPAMLRLGADQFVPRLQAYLDLAPRLRERVPDIDYVDLRFDDRVYVRPAEGSAGRR